MDQGRQDCASERLIVGYGCAPPPPAFAGIAGDRGRRQRAGGSRQRRSVNDPWLSPFRRLCLSCRAWLDACAAASIFTLRHTHFGKRLHRLESAAEFGPHAHHSHSEQSIAHFLDRQSYRRDVSRPRWRRQWDRLRWSRNVPMIARDCIEVPDRHLPVDACTNHTKLSADRPSAHAEERPIFH